MISELAIVRFFNHLGQGTSLDSLSFLISWIPFLVAFWTSLALLALIFDLKNGKKIILGVLLITLIYFFLNDWLIKSMILEHIFWRERPYLILPQEIFANGESWQDSSFPSGHLAITLALITLFIYYYRRFWVWMAGILLAILMAFSRIHNGMHYPSDVLAGAVLGILYGFLAIFIIGKIQKLVK